MADNRYKLIQDGKPVLNEQFEAYDPIKGPVVKKIPDTRPRDENKSRSKNEDMLQKGIRQFRLKQWEKALREFLEVVADNFSDGERTELAYYMGLCCSKLERFDDAILYLEQVITVGGDPMRGYQCRMILALIYIKTGRAKMAEFELNNVEAGGFESVMLYNTMAYTAYIQKRYLRAIELYEKALEIEQDNTTALNSLGYILADQGLDTVRGLRLCRKAVGKQPESAAYLDSLGWASYKSGRKMEASKWMRLARNIAPNEPEILEHIKIMTREGL